ncbi:glucose 1-dehydrogenase [Myxococcota bacterium]|nr:glucose 1-dehydrogenase [Myxococcota bacterium]
MTISEFDLSGKVAIVTGASRGIGRSIAIALARAGADVALAARKPEDLQSCASEVADTGRRALAIPTNVRRMEELDRLVDQTREELGRVDILVNNAGTNPAFGPIQNVDEKAWEIVMNTNVKAAFFLSIKAREAMLEHGEGGSIVNVSSVGGFRASDVIGAYSISKAAINMVTQVLAKTWGKDQIRVNGIAPGLIKTEFSRALWDNEKILQQALRDSALHRVGEPDEMAGAVVFLCSEAGSFVTGQTLVMDGGQLV